MKGIEPSPQDSKVVEDQFGSKCAEASNTQIRAQITDALGRDLSRVVAAWSELSPPLKAAILAIVNSASDTANPVCNSAAASHLRPSSAELEQPKD